MAQGQVQGDVVGVAMPMARPQRINHAEGRRPPTQPRALADQPHGRAPLTEAGEGQGPLPMGVEIVQAAPNRLGDDLPQGRLNQRGHPRQRGQGDGKQRQQQQGHQPNPAARTEHDRDRQDQGAPAIAGVGGEHLRHLGDHQGEADAPEPEGHGAGAPAAAVLQKGRQHERPAQGQPGRRDVGVIKQAREPTGRVAAAADPPHDRPAQ